MSGREVIIATCSHSKQLRHENVRREGSCEPGFELLTSEAASSFVQ
jgi:hypothetical protein